MNILNKLNNYLNEATNPNWICVKLDCNKKPYICIGLKKAIEADMLETLFQDYTDHTVFSVDNYGTASEKNIVKKYKPIEVIMNPKINLSFIKTLEKKLR